MKKSFGISLVFFSLFLASFATADEATSTQAPAPVKRTEAE